MQRRDLDAISQNQNHNRISWEISKLPRLSWLYYTINLNFENVPSVVETDDSNSDKHIKAFAQCGKVLVRKKSNLEQLL